MRSTFFTIIIFISINCYATNYTKSMTRYVQAMEGIFESSYAMKSWKTNHLNWNMEKKFEEIYNAISNNEIKTLSDFHRTLKKFIDSTSDWHTNIMFFRTGQSSLPLTIRSAEGRYFIVWIDRKKLPESIFPYEVGDEVVAMGNRKVSEIIAEKIEAAGGSQDDLTLRAFSELSLTSSSGIYKTNLPHGPIIITIKKKKEEFKKIHETSLTWNVKPELITDYNDDITLKNSPFLNPISIIKNSSRDIKRRLYISPKFLTEQMKARNKYDLGQKTSFLPKFGKIIWEASEDNYYQAYIYKTENNKFYGYFRIKDFMPFENKNGVWKQSKKAVTDLINIIKHFKEHTSGLVIDQLNNPGGDVFFGYFVASLLTNKVIETVPEKEILNQSLYLDSIERLEILKKIITEDDLKKFGENRFLGLELSFAFIEQMKLYNRNIIEDYKNKQKLTRLQYINGIKHILPNSEVNYDMPVIILVNELAISAGDYFPALIQDNKIATIFGTNTSGAGGYVMTNEIINNLGVYGFSTTGSISYRKNNQPIEDLGIKPDIEYNLTVEDLTDGHKGYIKAVNNFFR